MGRRRVYMLATDGALIGLRQHSSHVIIGVNFVIQEWTKNLLEVLARMIE